MDPIEIQERKRAAQQRLRAQRAKAGELRGRVVAISLICFALLWGVVFVQMATGNDPVLGDSPSTVAKGSNGRGRHAAKAAPAETGTSTNSGATEPEDPEEAFAEEPVEEEPVEAEAEPVEAEFVEEPAPVTTSQS